MVSGHRYFYAQFAVVAKPDVWGVGVFGKKYSELAFVQMNERMGCVAVKLYVGFGAVGHCGVFQRRDGSPAYYFCSFQGHVYVDESAVSLES